MKSSTMHSSFTGLALKIVGLIMIVASLLDFLVMIIPSPGDQPLSSAWQFALTRQLVDQGIVPMVGIAFLLAGYWVNTSGSSLSEQKLSFTDLRVWVFILSTLLGLMFLLLIPVHINSTIQQSNQRVEAITEQAAKLESQLETQMQQFDALIKNPDQFAQVDQRLEQQIQRASESGQVPPEQIAQAQQRLENLKQLQENPDMFTQEIEKRQLQIRTQKQEEESKARAITFKSWIKTGLSGLLLAIGYSIIGWMGLRSLSS